MEYRKEIDGLRALAVIPVILYHAGVGGLSGGFAGVDVFFVISGYLITSILMKEIDDGNFSILKFYERRAKRILPALFFVIICTIPFAYIYLLPDDANSFWRSVIAVCFFVSNILFQHETNYFASNVELKPLLHTWSLAVEEQFYLFFPIILLFLSKYFRKILIPTLGLIAVVSFSLSDKLSVLEPTFNFYSIATRAWELLIGAFAAFLYMRKEQVRVSWWAASMLSIIGVLLIASSYIYLDKTTPFPGRYALMPTVGAFLVILFAHGSCITGRILSIKPVVFIGLISYSAYLWHQPVMAILRHKYVYEPSSLVMITAILGTFALSVFSWKYIETPFRKTKSDTKKILSYSVAFLSLFATIGFAGVHTSILNRFDGNAAYNNAKIRLLGNYGLSKKCEESFTDAPECKTSDNPEIILWGDSYAMHLADMIVASRPDVKLQQVTISQCAPVIGASYATAIHGARKCIENNEKVFEYIKNKKSIKYVVLASPFERFGDNGAILLSNGQVLQHGAKPYYELFKATVIKLKQAGKVPVVIAPPPKYMKNDIGFCLMKSSLTDKDTSKCDFPIDESPIVQSLAIKALKGMSGMSKTIWLSDFICSDGRCHASQGGKFIYRDEGHLSIEGSKYLGAKNDIYHMIVN